jgi:GT2 family glycosyltransferase
MLYIILPVHNRCSTTDSFIECLLAQTYINYHLILIDDGSTDGTDSLVKSKINKLTIIKGQGSWWWAGSLQQGIDWLKRSAVDEKDVVVFMNDDVLFDANFLQTAIELLGEGDEFLLPQVINQQTGAIEESGVHADLKKLTFVEARSAVEINCLPTRGIFMRMSTLRKVGDFYPILLPHYLSDYEFTIRASRLGVRLRTSSKLLISVDEDASGFRDFNGLSWNDFLRKYFSKKSPSSPIYWTTFILLTSPNLFAPWQIVKVWLGAAQIVLRRAIHSNANRNI